MNNDRKWIGLDHSRRRVVAIANVIGVDVVHVPAIVVVVVVVLRLVHVTVRTQSETRETGRIRYSVRFCNRPNNNNKTDVNEFGGFRPIYGTHFACVFT